MLAEKRSREISLICICLVLIIFCSVAVADEFPVVGATYQLDRSKYPDKVAVCVSEGAMVEYMEALWAKDEKTKLNMLFNMSDFDDINKMKEAEGCTLISSFSQAKVIKKGIEVHQAEFYAFPLEAMWGYYDYFGGKVK